MDRRSWSFVTFVVATLVGMLLLGSGNARAGDCGGAALCFCGDTVVANRTLQCGVDPVTTTVCPATGLNVVSGVSLDLGGCTLRGSDVEAGVHLAPGSAMSVTNGRVTHFDTGVQGGDLLGITVSQLQVLANRSDGIALDSVRNSTIEQNVAVDNGGAGVLIVGGNTLVRLNRAESNGEFGFSISGSRLSFHGNTVTRNIARRNDAGGFTIRDFQRRDPEDAIPTTTLNRAEFNGGDGFVFEGDGLVVSRNVSDRNQGEGDGFEVHSSASVFSNNRLTNNPGFGIRNQAGGVQYLDNVCTGNDLGPSFVPGFC
jgi:parallel beta-helix repeat protein